MKKIEREKQDLVEILPGVRTLKSAKKFLGDINKETVSVKFYDGKTIVLNLNKDGE